MDPQNEQQQNTESQSLDSSVSSSQQQPEQPTTQASDYTATNSSNMPRQSTKKRMSRLSLVLVAVILLLVAGAGALFYMYANEHNDNVKNQGSLAFAQSQNKKLEDELKASIRPATLSAFSPQCAKDNSQDLVLARLNKDAVQGYVAYLAMCKSTFQTATIQPRVTVIQTNDQNEDKFVYGASATDPRCLTKNIAGGATSELASKAGLAICK